MVVHATGPRSKFVLISTIAVVGGVTLLLHHVAPPALRQEPISPGLPLAYLIDLCRLVLVYSLAVLLAFFRPKTIGLDAAARLAFRWDGLALVSVTAATGLFRRRSPYSRTAWGG